MNIFSSPTQDICIYPYRYLITEMVAAIFDTSRLSIIRRLQYPHNLRFRLGSNHFVIAFDRPSISTSCTLLNLH